MAITSYKADPYDPQLPTASDIAGYMYLEFQALKKRMNDQIGSDSTADSIPAQLLAITTQQANNTGDIAQHGKDIIHHNQLISTLETWKTSHQQEWANFGKEYVSFKNSTSNTLTSHGNTLSSYGTRISAVERKASSNASSISSISGTVSSHSSTLSSHGSRLNSLDSQYNSLDSKYNSLSSSVSSLSSRVGTVEGKVNSIASAVAGKQDKLNADQVRTIHISAGSPSGGKDGDIWLQYVL